MRIIECFIENFGKLSDFKLSFKDGLNTLKADNGYGKTTLSVFIKAMFYGLDDSKKTKIEENDRKHYLPWSSLVCGGSLSFICDKGEYRIERSFMSKASDDTFKLYDLKSGKESFDFSENIGEELFGIDSDGFERTIFLSEHNLSGKNENKTVSAKLSNLVGCEGDLSVMDDAIALLEKERKLYYKKGGAGEIGELKDKISALQERLAELKRTKTVLAEEEARFANINERLKALYQKRNESQRLAAELLKKRTRFSLEKQYIDMQKNLEREADIKKSHELFFKNGIPERADIEKAKAFLADAKRLKSECEAENPKDEYNALADFFKNAPDDERFEEIKKLSSIEKDKRREAEILQSEASAINSFDEFSKQREEKIDALIEEAKALKNANTVNKSWHITLPIGIISIILGIALSFIFLPLISVSAFGAVLTVLAILNIKASKNAEESTKTANRVKKTIESEYGVYNVNDDNILETLYKLKANMQSNAKEAERKEELLKKCSLLLNESKAIADEVNAFLLLFPESSSENTLDNLFKKHSEYTLLKKNHANELAKVKEKLDLSEKYAKHANDFLSLYPTVTSDPFGEISLRLIEYDTVSLSISRLKNSISEFITSNNIDPDNLLNPSDDLLPPPDTAEIDEEIASFERERTLSERSILLMTEECESIEEYNSEISELNEKKAEYEKRLTVIVKTKEFLTEAKDSLTSKYLSKTKSAFDEYVKLITGESGEDFNMDTSFTVMKREGRNLKPMAAYSRGSQDIYALATRFALIDSLYENELPFVILDDPFAYFDDAKLEDALSALKALAEKKQIIYLTCTEARSL